jgi:hypothetical protein
MRENVTFGFLGLANFTKIMFSSSTHLLANNKISFFVAE